MAPPTDRAREKKSWQTKASAERREREPASALNPVQAATGPHDEEVTWTSSEEDDARVADYARQTTHELPRVAPFDVLQSD